ncbi:MAG: MFS transporter [Spirochaetales bacterium]|nr:MFS transporter [Spirochaetales bacterium]
MTDQKVIDRIDRAAFASMFIYAAAANTFPVCLVKMSEELSFNLTQAGLLGFITSLEQLLVLFLSCFAAAKFGKIKILKTALLVLTGSLFLFSFSSTYLTTVALMLLIGLGYAFLEALLTPLVEDLHPKDSGSKMNLLHASWPVGVCFAVLIVGELLSRGVSWRYVFMGLAACTLIIFFFYPGAKKVNLPRSRTDFSHMGEILAQPRFWALGAGLFFAGAAEFSFAFWSASYIQIHYGTLPRAGGFGAAAFAFGMVAGRMASAKIIPKTGLKNLIIYSAVAGFMISLSFFFINGLILLYIFLFLMGLTIACFWPSIQSYSARVLPVDATILMIFLSCFGVPGTSTASLLMGILGDKFGLHIAFVVAPVSLILLILSLLIEGKMKVGPVKAV